ncbi:SulP family inorganic anion transporter [Corallococcus llansteffanensis]|uniref:SulP family inorganic anion transporter n=1 Tax=Corallococcus llansteffanensis TaxID=2316731 RepID=A0A3A8PEY3_9BACT|nr:SulP family inorganic anion transporter [Corallococcus llansteffanensis]RKH51062.1 SulP family inorganic anion transporter [Corallococcus llansteffanensis]
MNHASTKSSSSWLARAVPFVSTVRGYRRPWLKRDVMGALTVTALLIPEGMAYAQLAGLPPTAAFYAAPAGLVLYALFGSSRQLIVAVSAAVAVLSAATVGPLAAAGSPRFVVLTAALAMMAGLISLLAGVLRLGRIAQFFSASVLTGFVFGLALVIAIKQVPKLFGIESGEGNFFERLAFLVTHLGGTHLVTLLVGAGSLLLLLGLERVSERLPAALVVLAVAVGVTALLGLDARGVEVVGKVQAGLAAPRLPDVGLRDLVGLLPGACGIALVAFAEAIGPARMLAGRHGYEVNANRELVGLGAANVGAGLFQGFSIGCSLSKSAANDAVGARTEVSAMLAAGLTLLVALFLTPLFRLLPEATLGAIVVVAVSGMMDVKELRRLYRLRRADFLGALVALVGVLALDVLPGLLVAVGLSLFLMVYRASVPHLSELGRTPGTLAFSDVRHTPRPLTVPGMLILRPNEGVFFANATSLKDEILARVRRAARPPQVVLLDLEVTADLDVPGADMLADLHDELARRSVTLQLARIMAPTRRMLERTGVAAKVGSENLHAQVLDAVVGHLVHAPSETLEEQALLRDGLHRLRGLVEEAGATSDADDAAERERLQDLGQRLGQAESRWEAPGSAPH